MIPLTDEGRRVIYQAMETAAASALNDYYECEDERQAPLLARTHLLHEQWFAFSDTLPPTMIDDLTGGLTR